MAPQFIGTLLISILCMRLASADIDINSWTYAGANKTSESYWPDIPGSYCDGQSQSPIDIDTDSTTSATYVPFNLDSYKIEMNATLENNGHALKIDDLSEDQSSGYYDITGGGLSGTFRAFQFHFHFGSNSSQGSEHTVNGKHYPAEMHIVHYSTAYPSPNEAIQVKGGIAVLGFFLEEGDYNSELDIILDEVNNVKEPEQEYHVSDLQLSALLPSSLNQFWRYEGSLTTPLCNQVVTWTLFNDTIEVSTSQLNILRTLMSETYDENGNQLPMADNYRSIQPTNGRIIYSVASASATRANVVRIVFLFLAALYITL